MRNSCKILIFYFVFICSVLGVVIIGIEIWSRFVVYGVGLYLNKVDSSYYSRLMKSDPPYKFKKNFYIPHKKFGWAHTPNNQGIFRGWSYPYSEFRNSITINSSGFRSSSNYLVDPNKLRIAVLGDSFVQALQVKEEDTFPKVIERLLNNTRQSAFVYNFGMSSTGTIHQYQIFQEEILKVKPQIIILAFFHNDLIDDSPYYFHEDSQLIPHYVISYQNQIVLSDFREQTEGQRVFGGYAVTIKESTPLPIRIFMEKLDAAIIKVPFLTCLKLLSAILKEKFPVELEYPGPFDVYKKVYPVDLEESVRVTTYFMEQMQRICSERGIKFLVVFIPAREQAKPSLWNNFLEKRKVFLSASDFDVEQPNKVMKSQLGKLHIRYLDLLPFFREKYEYGNFYYNKDMHFNKQGHLLAGTIITEYIKANFIQK